MPSGVPGQAHKVASQVPPLKMHRDHKRAGQGISWVVFVDAASAAKQSSTKPGLLLPRHHLGPTGHADMSASASRMAGDASLLFLQGETCLVISSRTFASPLCVLMVASSGLTWSMEERPSRAASIGGDTGNVPRLVSFRFLGPVVKMHTLAPSGFEQPIAVVSRLLVAEADLHPRTFHLHAKAPPSEQPESPSARPQTLPNYNRTKVSKWTAFKREMLIYLALPVRQHPVLATVDPRLTRQR